VTVPHRPTTLEIPLPRRLSAAPFASLLAAGIALALAGCTPESAPAVEPSSEPETVAPSDPTPSADPLESVATVVIRPERLDLVDAGGAVVAELSYDDEATAIVETLATVFGSDAEVEEFAGSCCEAPRMTIYRWDGFRVTDDNMGHFTDDAARVWVDEDRPDTYNMNVNVVADGAAVGDIALTTGVGFSIGDDPGTLPDSVDHPAGPEWTQIAVETGPELGPPVIEGRPNAYSVVMQVAGPGGEPRLIAPLNLGVGSV